MRTAIAMAVLAASVPLAGDKAVRARDSEATMSAPVVLRGSVADRVRLGDAESEAAHQLTSDGGSEMQMETIEQGQLTERVTARSVAAGGRFTARLQAAEEQPLTLQFRELRPNDAWGAGFGFRVYLDGQLHYVRDPASPDPGGGPYSSFFLETRDPEILRDGWVEVTVEGTDAEPAYFSDIWSYADLTRMVTRQDMRVPDRLVFVLGQDYLSDELFRERLDDIKENIHSSDRVGLGMGFLDYFTVRTGAQMAANYQRYLRLSREYGLPFAIESTADWEGTPRGIPDGKGGYFGDLQYQQILWSPQDQTGPDKDVYVNPGGETQRLTDLLGEDYEQHYGLSVPNIWGNTPWLTWRHPDLNAYYERKANESLEEVGRLLSELQRQGEAWRILPFSTANESVYWSKRSGIGVADRAYTEHNGGVERRDLYADYNPYTVAAAAEDGVTLDPTDGLSDAEKAWLYKNQSHHQQLFADAFYWGMPRERIQVIDGRLVYPKDMLRHNIHSEIYSRMQEPYYSGVFPSTAQGVVERARPGAQYISLNNYNPGGFYHLQKLREFGRIANPNLESSVSGHPPDKTLLLRQAYVNGSRYTSPYNWHVGSAAEWINPFVDDLMPWDVVHDTEPDGEVSGQIIVSQELTAGELRLANRIDARLHRDGQPAPLRLTIYNAPDKTQVVAMRHLAASEIVADGWVAFSFPIVELERGQTYLVEIEQLGDGSPAYVFPTATGSLLYRVGLDLEAERDRSMVITWRRDAADAIRHVTADLTPGDTDAQHTLAAARRALTEHRYVDAYRLAIKADAQRLPVSYYSADGTSTLAPFPLTVQSGTALDVDVRTFQPNRELAFAITTYASGRVDIAVEGFADRDVFVDSKPVRASRDGKITSFRIDSVGPARHDIRIR
ncbi:MAG: hypothetical protein GEV06_05615 [Luteitalea sp.]|nr:hypothetical protein [Luteitalea sp.]